MIKIYDNFLDEDSYKQIESQLSNQEFPWYYNNTKLSEKYTDMGLYDYQFTHIFYNNFAPQSHYIEIITPIIEKINPTALVRIKANMTMASPKIKRYHKHVDFEGCVGLTTSIYYLNTNNGNTVLDTGETIKSVANRLIMFDSNILHCGTTHTDTKYRMLINFNFFE